MGTSKLDAQKMTGEEGRQVGESQVIRSPVGLDLPPNLKFLKTLVTSQVESKVPETSLKSGTGSEANVGNFIKDSLDTHARVFKSPAHD